MALLDDFLAIEDAPPQAQSAPSMLDQFLSIPESAPVEAPVAASAPAQVEAPAMSMPDAVAALEELQPTPIAQPAPPPPQSFDFGGAFDNEVAADTQSFASALGQAKPSAGEEEAPLELHEPTGEKTDEGRIIYFNNRINPDGSRGKSSEYTIGVIDERINNGQETHIPSIYNGYIVDEKTAIDIIVANKGRDPETGRLITPGGDPAARSESRKPSATEAVIQAGTTSSPALAGSPALDPLPNIVGVGETALELGSGILSQVGGGVQGTSAVITDFAESLIKNDPDISYKKAFSKALDKFAPQFYETAEAGTYAPRTEMGKKISDATLGMISEGIEKAFKGIDDIAENKDGKLFGGQTPESNPFGAVAFTTASKAALMGAGLFGGRGSPSVKKFKNPSKGAEKIDAVLRKVEDPGATPAESASALSIAEKLVKDGKATRAETKQFLKQIDELKKRHGGNTAQETKFQNFLGKLKERVDGFLKKKEETASPNRGRRIESLETPVESGKKTIEVTDEIGKKTIELTEPELSAEAQVKIRQKDIAEQIGTLKEEIKTEAGKGNTVAVERKSALANKLTNIDKKLTESLLAKKPDPAGQQELIDEADKVTKLPEDTAETLKAEADGPVKETTTGQVDSLKAEPEAPGKVYGTGQVESLKGEATQAAENPNATSGKTQKPLVFNGEEIPQTTKIIELIEEHDSVTDTNVKEAIKQEIKVEVEKAEDASPEALVAILREGLGKTKRSKGEIRKTLEEQKAERDAKRESTEEVVYRTGTTAEKIVVNSLDAFGGQVRGSEDIASTQTREDLVTFAKTLNIPRGKKNKAELAEAIHNRLVSGEAGTKKAVTPSQNKISDEELKKQGEEQRRVADENAKVKQASQDVELKKITEAPQPKKQVGGKENDLLLNRPLKNGETKMPFEFALKERGDVIASNKANFSIDERFPLGTQDRLREDDPAQQARLEKFASKPELDRIFNDTPTPGDGLPITVNGSIVAGGNGRKILLDKLVEERGQGELVRQAIIDSAEKFGFTKEQVAGFKDPIITRDLKTEVESLDEFRDIVAALNEDSSAALNTNEKAVSVGRRISESTTDLIGRIVTEGKKTTNKDGTVKRTDRTLIQALDDSPTQILDALIKDGAFSESQRGELYDASTERLTSNAKNAIADAMVGRVLEDAKLLGATPRAIRNTIATVVPSLLKTSTKGATEAGFNILEDFRGAVENASDAFNSGTKNSTDHLRQTGLFTSSESTPMTEIGRFLFQSLMDESATKFSTRLKEYGSVATDVAAGQGSMFDNQTPQGAMNDAFGDLNSGGPLRQDKPAQSEGKSRLSGPLNNERGGIDPDKLFSFFKKKKDENDLAAIEKKMSEDPLTRDMWKTLRENQKKILDGRKSNSAKIWRSLNRGFADTSGNIRRELSKTQAGQAALIKSDAIKGAPSEAATRTHEFHTRVFDQLSEADMDVLQQIIKARRNVDIGTRNPEVKHEGGYTSEQYAKFLEQIPSDTLDRLAPAIEDTFAYFRAQLDVVYTEGLIDRKSYDALVKSDYSPRLFEQHIDPVDNIKFDGKNINVSNSGLPRITTGSIEAMESDLRALSADYTGRIWSRIFKNRANREMFKFAKNNPDNGFVKPFDKKGKLDAPNGWVEFDFMEKGKKHSFIITDELAGEWVVRDPLITAQLATWLQTLSGTSALKASATGLNPFFAITNLPRDMMHVWAVENQFSAHLPVALGQMAVDAAATFKDAWAFKIQGAHRDAISQGMGMNFLTQQGEILKKAGIIKMVKNKKTGIYELKSQSKLMKGMEYLHDALAFVGSRSELHVRLMLRNRAIKNGYTPEQATWFARRYLDFGRGGAIIKAADNGIPYLNAAFQATRGLPRAFEEAAKGENDASKTKLGIKLAWLAGTAVALTQYNQVLMGDDYNDIPSDIRARNWIIGTGITKTDELGRKRHLYFKIAKDQAQSFYTAGIEAATTLFTGGKVDTKAIEIAGEQSSPIDFNSFNMPVLEAYQSYQRNYDSFKKKPFWRGQNVEANAEFYPWTHPLAKKIGKLTSSEGEDGVREGGVSPTRLVGAAGKALALGNPVLNSSAQAIRYFMEETGPETSDKVGEFFTEEYFNRYNYKSTIAKKFFGWTDPRSNFETKEIINRADKIVNTRRLNQTREFDKERDKSRGDGKKFISKQHKLDKNRLKSRDKNQFKAERKKQIPAQENIKKLQFMLPEAAAMSFEGFLEAADPQEKVRLNNALKANKKVNTESFKQFRKKFQRSRK